MLLTLFVYFLLLQVLLSLLINKIGDPDRKIASKAVYLSRSLGEGSVLQVSQSSKFLAFSPLVTGSKNLLGVKLAASHP